MSSSAETSFDYEGVVWTCVLLPYRIIACRDAIQYIVQIRNEKAYRSLSYFSEWEPIGRHYPQLATAGLPQHSPELCYPVTALTPTHKGSPKAAHTS